MATCELVSAIAMTEPGTGSDLQSVKTWAVRDGDDYVINGAKTFITNGTHADLVIIVARTSDEPGAKGLSAHRRRGWPICPGSPAAAYSTRSDCTGRTRGSCSSRICASRRERPRRSRRPRISSSSCSSSPQERLAIAVGGAATVEFAVRETVAYAKEREAFGRPILGFQNTKFVLAECATEALSVRTFIDHLTSEHIKGTLYDRTGLGRKVLGHGCSEPRRRPLLQIFGGYGYMSRVPDRPPLRRFARAEDLRRHERDHERKLIACGL